MKTRTFVIFGIVAVLLGVLLPIWALGKSTGETETTTVPTDVPAAGRVSQARNSFADNCGSCHTLKAAGTDGVVGPNLDDLLNQAPPQANYYRVLNAVRNGVNGRMPKGIVTGEEAVQVASYVAQAGSTVKPQN